MKNLFKALAAFQQECPIIHKSTQGYGYSYADLPTILKTINPLLGKHGLGFTQPVDLDTIQTIIFHVESGEQLTSSTLMPSDVELKGMNKFQVDGSKISYYRRYSLSSILGLVTDKDTDAGGVQTKAKPKAKPAKKTEEKTTPKDLTPDIPEWKDAIKYLKGAGKMSKIKEAWTLTKENESLLMEAVL
jgi:hypothetical protein|tara:strand:- start:6094 stop:6657 length:564 start_codon:yes stop_codon:yes gene_type:complete